MKKENLKNNNIRIISQAFYGNKMVTTVNRQYLDEFILGWIDPSLCPEKEFDRSIIRVPNTDNLVFVYSKTQEAIVASKKDERKPLLCIPEEGVEVYSRVIVARINDDGELESIVPEDVEKVDSYLAD